jgi:quercetin dioxygenase-like cupin family protein
VGSSRWIVPAGAGVRQPNMPGEVFTWMTSGEDNGGAMDFAELSLDPGVRVPEHIHHRNHEAYYILDGTYRFKVGDEVAEASSGTFVFIPQGTPHAWVNTGTERGRVALIFTPGGLRGLLTDIAPLVPDLMIATTDTSMVNPDVMAQAAAVFEQYGYELVGPPLT